MFVIPSQAGDTKPDTYKVYASMHVTMESGDLVNHKF